MAANLTGGNHKSRILEGEGDRSKALVTLSIIPVYDDINITLEIYIYIYIAGDEFPLSSLFILLQPRSPLVLITLCRSRATGKITSFSSDLTFRIIY